jgi:hypothetical protein
MAASRDDPTAPGSPGVPVAVNAITDLHVRQRRVERIGPPGGQSLP